MVPSEFSRGPASIQIVPTIQDVDEAAYETTEENSEDEDPNDTMYHTTTPHTTITDVTVLPPQTTSNSSRSQELRRSGREHALMGFLIEFLVKFLMELVV